ncbi:hypothetical protein ACR777_09760 [Sphingobacterium spiritivorum]|uniref:hypothetical protein n=1 Tax=Sphingobacterium spiritivorum TaxID=258 RepID=UPI003DA42ECE
MSKRILLKLSCAIYLMSSAFQQTTQAQLAASGINLRSYIMNMDMPRLNLQVSSTKVVAPAIEIAVTAVGRASAEGKNDGQRLPLLYDSFCHPSVVYVNNKWNGFRYWMAMSPYFGQTKSDPGFENPTVVCSNDGIHWEEPKGIRNPIDIPPAKPSHAYWSDPKLYLDDKGLMHIFYRGDAMPNGKLGVRFGDHERAIVHRSSRDGAGWSKVWMLYSSDSEGVDAANLLLSPAIFQDHTGRYNCYDVIYSSAKHPIGPQGNQTHAFVHRRTSAQIDSFGKFSTTQLCKFINRPWGTGMDPWHLDAFMVGRLYFMLIDVGRVNNYYGNELYIAYSQDGINFKVINTPLSPSGAYKSAMYPIKADGNEIQLGLYRADNKTGVISYEIVSLMHKD